MEGLELTDCDVDLRQNSEGSGCRERFLQSMGNECLGEGWMNDRV